MQRIQEKFSYLTNEDLAVLSKYSKINTYKKDTIIIDHGRFEPYFYYVINGVVRGYSYTDKGTDHNLFFIHDEQYFLSPEKMLNKERVVNNFIFETVTDCTIFKIHHDKLLKLAMQNPHIFEFYHDALSVLLGSFMERIRLLTIENAEERYIHLMKSRPLLAPNVQKKHLAQFLGITPNSFSRLLRLLKKNKQ